MDFKNSHARVIEPEHASMAMRAVSIVADDARGLGCRDVAERDDLAARDDRREHAFPRAAQKDDHHVGGRLLERL